MNTNLLRILPCMLPIAVAVAAFGNEPSEVGADEALQRLLDGNARFVAGKPNVRQTSDLIERRRALVQEQKPFAVILGCSDSRVPPELVFDVGLGDIFVIRTAGEVVDTIDVGSIEYAVEHLGTPLIVVLGHERCGAVNAAVTGGNESGSIPAVLKAISAAVAETKGKSGDAIDNVVRANAIDIARHLATMGPIISPRVQSGKVKIVAARYDLDSGKVELLK